MALFFSKQMLGLDMGSFYLKVARLARVGRKYRLKRFGAIPIPVNTVVDGSIMNTYEMNDAIKTLLTKEHLSDKYCAISIAGHGIISRIISMAPVPPADFKKALRSEVETHIPHDINEIYYDGIRTGVVEDNKERVILIAARQDLVGDFMQVAQTAGIRPMSVEIDASALANIFEVNYPEELGQTVALLNIGASKVNVVILSKGVISFFRDIPNGGNFITEEITRRLKVSFQQAESLKSGEQTGDDSILPQQVEEVVADVAKNMVSDIQRVFDYYGNINPEDKIQKIFLTGGTTRSHTFVTTVKSLMAIAVEKMNPFKEIVVPPSVLTHEQMEADAHIAAVSLGLALRRLDEE